jgi:hypothetical protein
MSERDRWRLSMGDRFWDDWSWKSVIADGLSLEELYQAFRARLLKELRSLDKDGVSRKLVEGRDTQHRREL